MKLINLFLFIKMTMSNSPNHESVARLVIDTLTFPIPVQFIRDLSEKKFVRFNGVSVYYHDPDDPQSDSDLIMRARTYSNPTAWHTLNPKMFELHSNFVQLQLDTASTHTDHFVCFSNRDDEWREFYFDRPISEIKFWFTYKNDDVIINPDAMKFTIELELFV